MQTCIDGFRTNSNCAFNNVNYFTYVICVSLTCASRGIVGAGVGIQQLDFQGSSAKAVPRELTQP